MNIIIINKNQVFKFLTVCLILFSSFLGTKDYLKDVYTATANMNKMKSIASVDTEDMKVGLTFEINSSDKNLEDILRILESENSKATFFVTGAWAENNPEKIKLIHEKGHELGNHTYSHQRTESISDTVFSDEVKTCHNTVKKILGIDMSVFKFPYDEYTNQNVETIYKLKYFPISYDVESKDYKEYGIANLKSQVLENKELGKGSIIEFNLDAKYTSAALQDIIKGLTEKGYECVKVSDMLYKDNYLVDYNGIQRIKLENS